MFGLMAHFFHVCTAPDAYGACHCSCYPITVTDEDGTVEMWPPARYLPEKHAHPDAIAFCDANRLAYPLSVTA